MKLKLHPCVSKAEVGDILCMNTPRYQECLVIGWKDVFFGGEEGILRVPKIMLNGKVDVFHPKYDKPLKIIKRKV